MRGKNDLLISITKRNMYLVTGLKELSFIRHYNKVDKILKIQSFRVCADRKDVVEMAVIYEHDVDNFYLSERSLAKIYAGLNVTDGISLCNIIGAGIRENRLFLIVKF